MNLLPPLKPLPIKDRVSMIFIQYGQIDVLDGAFVVVDKTGVRTHIPVGSVACIMLEPGTRISHAAVRLASQVGTLLVWVGESGVRLYASGQRVAHGQIACCTRQSWHWTTICD
jgi:CRISPR-associated protein Cas1